MPPPPNKAKAPYANPGKTKQTKTTAANGSSTWFSGTKLLMVVGAIFTLFLSACIVHFGSPQEALDQIWDKISSSPPSPSPKKTSKEGL